MYLVCMLDSEWMGIPTWLVSLGTKPQLVIVDGCGDGVDWALLWYRHIFEYGICFSNGASFRKNNQQCQNPHDNKILAFGDLDFLCSWERRDCRVVTWNLVSGSMGLTLSV